MKKLKAKLIELTLEYVELKGTYNAYGRNLHERITEIRKSIEVLSNKSQLSKVIAFISAILVVSFALFYVVYLIVL